MVDVAMGRLRLTVTLDSPAPNRAPSRNVSTEASRLERIYRRQRAWDAIERDRMRRDLECCQLWQRR